MKNKKGVTLVSLITTVVIMLMLTLVTINLVLDQKTIDDAGKYTNQTVDKINDTQNRIDQIVEEMETIE